MSKMIQLRNVPDELHRKLKLRAIETSLTLTDYLIRVVAAAAERPTIEELIARIRTRDEAELTEEPADAVRSERESRR
jgi:plasmid stability protein